MSFETPINMSSAALVGDELNKSLEKSVQYVEAYLAEPSDEQLLDKAMAELQQVNGILRLLEIHGAIELSGGLLLVCQALREKRLVLDEEKCAVLARGFVMLPRYIDHSIKGQCIRPLVLNDCINRVRALLRQAPLLEAEQIGFAPGSIPEHEKVGGELCADGLGKVKRLQHMYQVGLLGVLRDRSMAANLHLMERSLSRLRSDFPSLATEEWWVLVTAVVHLMGQGVLRVTFTRKRMLGAVDAYLRKRCRGVENPTLELSDAHRAELLLLVEISADKAELCEVLRQQYALPVAPYDDKYLGRIEHGLVGAAENSLDEVANDIRHELVQVKDLLEVYRDNMTVETAGNISNRMQLVAQMLGNAGFSRLKGLLDDKAFQFNQSMAAGVIDRDATHGLAEALLMVENTLEDPELFNDHAMAEGEQGADVLARRLLDEAAGVVINESKGAISLAKRGITAYLESNMDIAHVSNVGTSLAMVRGAFAIMGYARAAEVLQHCIEYIDGFGLHGGRDSARQSVETLADALISIEYYLDELSVSDRDNGELLGIAEESMAELLGAA